MPEFIRTVVHRTSTTITIEIPPSWQEIHSRQLEKDILEFAHKRSRDVLKPEPEQTVDVALTFKELSLLRHCLVDPETNCSRGGDLDVRLYQAQINLPHPDALK